MDGRNTLGGGVYRLRLLARAGFPWFKVLLRTFYISLLATLGLLLVSNEPISKHQAAEIFGEIESRLGLLFYFAWVIGNGVLSSCCSSFPRLFTGGSISNGWRGSVGFGI